MNKSTLLIVDGNSDIKYPTVNAVKQYVDSVLAISGGINNNQIINVVDASATTKGIVQLAGDLTGTAAQPRIANGAVTDAKIVSVAGAKVTGDIAGNAATATNATLAANATKLATPRTINGVAFPITLHN